MKKKLLILVLLINISSFSQDSLNVNYGDLYDKKQYDQIINEYSQKTKEFSAKDLYFVGMAYYMKEDDNNCLKLMDLSILKDSINPDAFYIKGKTLSYLGRFKKSIEPFKKAIKLYPESSVFYSGLGDSYFNLKNLDESLKAYIKATEQKEVIDRPYTMIPQVYAAKNDSKNALKAFYVAKNKISKTGHSYITALYNIGLYELLNRNYDNAEIHLKELIKLKPDDFHSYAKLIQAYYGKKDYSKAKPLKEKLYEAYHKGILKDNLKNMFCFDQFDWNNKLIQVYEKFHQEKGKLYYKHLFYVVNEKGEIEDRIQTENSPISVEMGGPKYAIGMDKDGTHSTFAFINEDFNYEDLKGIVIKILEKKVNPTSSSTSIKSKKKKRRKKKNSG